MKLKLAAIVSGLMMLSMAFVPFKKGEEKKAFQWYTGDGKKAEWSDVIKASSKKEVVFFGEFHNDPIGHWFQLQLLKDLKKEGRSLVLGAEMFEADNQLIMDEYLAGRISEKNFDSELRAWPNYKTDYKPLVNWAKENKAPFVACNIPRRYANMVYKDGLESLNTLSEEAKRFIAPLPIEYDGEVKCYKDMMEMAGGHGGENLPKAQAIKDATMAHFISKNLEKEKTFVHFNGAYHSDHQVGILWYLKKYAPQVSTLTISTALQADLDKLGEEEKEKADFILVVAEDMTTTH